MKALLKLSGQKARKPFVKVLSLKVSPKIASLLNFIAVTIGVLVLVAEFLNFLNINVATGIIILLATFVTKPVWRRERIFQIIFLGWFIIGLALIFDGAAHLAIGNLLDGLSLTLSGAIIAAYLLFRLRSALKPKTEALSSKEDVEWLMY